MVEKADFYSGGREFGDNGGEKTTFKQVYAKKDTAPLEILYTFFM